MGSHLGIHGADDLQPEKASRSYAHAFPTARFEVLPGAGHFPFLDKPEELGRLVEGFLARLPGTPTADGPLPAR